MWDRTVYIPGSQDFTKRFWARFGHPPENQACHDYTGARIILHSIAETRSTDPEKLIAHLEKGSQFDILKPRKAYFSARDHQLAQEMFVVRVKEKAQMKDQSDFFEILRAAPPPANR